MSCTHEHSDDFIPEAIIGEKVETFVMEAFDPEDCGFCEVDFEKIQKAGKWTVLFFYPADFTFVCPTELADLACKHAALEKLGCEVISVSTDTKFVHLAWKTDERLLQDVKFKMAADPTGEVSDFFGVYDPATGLALRGTFIINPDGVLVSSEVNFYNVGRNADELLRKVEANVYLKDHPAEACPAKWTPGEKTLTPSEKLVGKVYEELNRK
ncbi:MAG: peroxiredoxin [Desulfovibrio sp. S3730MH75]|nr:MAG: peroxiredoxin [Desulfovibrio sp. S3730MH75]